MSRINFGAADFSAEDYVYGLCDIPDITLADIQAQQERLKRHTETNSLALRANVNKNYANFIETAKETSKLESDMFELSNLLNEQSAILRGLNLTLAPAATAQSPEVDSERLTLADVQGLERAGLSPLAATDCLAAGPLDLLDVESYSIRGHRHFFLLPDLLLIARPSKPGKEKRLVFDDIAPLATLRIADPGDGDSDVCHFTLEADERVWLVAAPSPSDKRMWLTALRRALGRHRGSKENFDDDEGGDDHHTWLHDAPEDIEVFIAQRAYESAVELVERAQDALHESTNRLDALPQHIDACARKLAAALCKEMSRPALRRHGIRAAVQLLLRLDEHEKACRSYLETWSQTLQREFRRLKMEGSTELFVFKLSQMFYGLLRSTRHEFGYLFDNSATSAYVRWAHQQQAVFAAVFARQALESTTASLATVAECVHVAQQSCAVLLQDGLDLEFSLLELLSPGIIHAIEEAGRSWISATAHHLTDETWEKHKFSSRQAQQTFQAELAEYGVDHADDYMDKGLCLLFETTIAFCIETREFFSNAARLLRAETLTTILEWTTNVFLLFISKLSQNFDGRNEFHTNAAFVLDFVLPATKGAFEKKHGAPISALQQLTADMARTWADASSEEGITHL
eukprot:m.47737 g.47737  ORF g.47737 m.47737 type:complete len:631 (-) comp5996_c0_seq2:202-2094(-)